MGGDAEEKREKKAMRAAVSRTLEALGVAPDKVGELVERLVVDVVATWGPRGRRSGGEDQVPQGKRGNTRGLVGGRSLGAGRLAARARGEIWAVAKAQACWRFGEQQH